MNDDYRTNVFGHASHSLIYDLRLLIEAIPKIDNDLIDFYKNYSDPSEIFGDLIEILADTKYDKAEIKNVQRITRRVIKNLIVNKKSLDDLAKDFRELGYDSNQVITAIKYFDMILDQYPNIKADILREEYTNKVVDTITSIGFCMDSRAVYKDNKLYDLVPILLTRMTLMGDNKEEEHVFQLSNGKLEQLINILQKEHIKMQEFKRRVNLANE